MVSISSLAAELIRTCEALMLHLGLHFDEARGEYYMDDITLKHSWAEADACDLCEDCEAQGWIEESEPFDSGEAEPPHHPNCKCDVEYKDTTHRVYV